MEAHVKEKKKANKEYSMKKNGQLGSIVEHSKPSYRVIKQFLEVKMGSLDRGSPKVPSL
jgi:hypothetical protein